MKQSSFDGWLTLQDDEPAHFTFDIKSLNYDWSIEHSVIDGLCSHCDLVVGIDSDYGSTKNYWQIDIDGEVLWCDECYETLTAEIGETK